MWCWYKLADGTEGGTNVSFTANGTTAGYAWYARAYRFTAGIAFNEIQPIELIASIAGSASPVTGPTITTTTPSRRAVFLLAYADNPGMNPLSGETGGNWLEAVTDHNSGTGGDADIQIQTANLPTAGTISGGSYTPATSAAWVLVSFVLVPRLRGVENTEITITEANTLAASSTRTDSLAVAISEAKTLAISLSRTDTVSLSISEASDIFANVAFAVADSLGISVEEATRWLISFNRTEVLAVAIGTEIATILSSVGRTDTLIVALAELAAALKPFSGTDALTVGVAEASALASSLSRLDALLVAIAADPPAMAKGLGYDDAPTVALSDRVESLLVMLSRTDAITVLIDDMAGVEEVEEPEPPSGAAPDNMGGQRLWLPLPA